MYPYRLFQYLTSQGYRIQVVTFKYEKNLPSKEARDGIAIKRVHYWFRLSKGFFSPFFVCSLFKYIRKTDVVIINQPSIEGVGALILARIFNKKAISLYHCQLQSNTTFFNTIITYLVNSIVFIELLLSDVIVGTNADYLKKIAVNILHKKTTMIMPPIIHYPVVADIYADYVRQKKENIWIGFCGRISREKGLEYLIEAYETIRTKIPSVLFVFAGPSGDEVAGEKQYYEKIKRLLKDKKIPHIFLGTLDNKAMGAFYQALDCLALPSTNSTEAFGMVQAEAMLLGTPVVASYLPGVRVPIRLTGMGIIVPPKNAHMLAQALVRVIKYRYRYTNSLLIDKAKKIFDLSYCCKQWKDILRKY